MRVDRLAVGEADIEDAAVGQGQSQGQPGIGRQRIKRLQGLTR